MARRAYHDRFASTMPTTLAPQDFVAKWRKADLKERSSVQEHFIDLCRLVGHPTPAEDDPTGGRFAFEAGVSKTRGGQGFADVWKRGYFAWEYKGKHANLERAYQQLLQYREALLNPPLLVVSDTERIVVHTNFTNTVKQVYAIGLDDLLTPAGLARLRAVFTDPDTFRTPDTPESVTREAAAQFARLADRLRAQGADPREAAHFLIRLLFCLFAEDVGLLPAGLFARLLDAARRHADRSARLLGDLFAAMAAGGFFGADEIRHFDGGLFDDAFALPLDKDSLDLLAGVTALDWSSIEPSVFGTLFERSLDPDKRAQLGAHYTSREDILLIVEPVLMAPLRRAWADVQVQARALAEKRDAAKGGQRTRLDHELQALLSGFADRLTAIRVLDPACGSGNFLYVALKQLLDLEKEVRTFAAEFGLTSGFSFVHPRQVYGIEKDDYAHELAQATVWIGYLQWLHDNGYGIPPEPILQRLDTIRQMDAILAHDEQGRPAEPAWPAADVIIGNPPFLGGNKIRQELGDRYVDRLFRLYEGRVPAFADLVCYWFEKARAMIERREAQRAGLLATNSIRGGANRKVLERIKTSGDIFMAWSDRPWILEGAAVRVSLVGFDDASEVSRSLDGVSVTQIHSDLTASVDLTIAARLEENIGICLRSDEKGGPFDISNEVAQTMLTAPLNVNGRPNSDVVRRWVNALDIVRRSRNMWIIDFGPDTPFEDAVLYELPFKYVEQHVKPVRVNNNMARLREFWWLHRIPGADMREALAKLPRYIATPRVAKHRLFVWLDNDVLADCQLYVFARDDDYFFGVLHSKAHELWALRQGTWLGVGNDPRYTPTTTFETFPFPWPPGQEPHDDPRVAAIAEAAADLVHKRDAWLNPPGASDADLKKRTLTNLYNERPTWLALAHARLDRAVFAAYGWPPDLGDEEILARLLALNLERARGQGAVASAGEEEA